MMLGMRKGMLAVIAAFGVITVSACSGTDDEGWRIYSAEAACKDSVKKQLKDPDSAEFGTVTVTESGAGKYAVTGTVNARNSFGGYTGMKPFTCSARDDGEDRVIGRATLSR